ncbi:Type I phosphodiesterase / nucleotide pyrophosphatase [Aquisphaera giovannonii]|uniref:Type I phosphodiesterase / nucleotide pyrophosphatase n=1 Tax=Aquisphaera giovannonii TaxID=406548 RepID=A0A5B9VWM0_9BACT|nr:alkaline phosphatase family protein [Aquisphaera giovannonii]QEH32454.1 Type I phosphodiesterase / nucleotide pyrophosphatase [Aquisphaera giovannonii]
MKHRDLDRRARSRRLRPEVGETLEARQLLSGAGRNVVIIVVDGLRPGSINPTDAPTLYSIQQSGVNFTNSHSVFPTFTTPNSAAIATGHYPGDTGDFSNTVYAGYPVPPAGLSPTPFLESDSVLGDVDEHYGGNFLSEESLLAYARQNGYDTAAVGKLGPVLIQDVTQGNPSGGAVPAPTTIVIDDNTGKAGGIPLPAALTQRLVAAGVIGYAGQPAGTVSGAIAGAQVVAPDRSNRDPSQAFTGPAANVASNNGFSGSNVAAGTAAPNTVQQQFFTDAITKGVLPQFASDGKPFAMVYWSRDADGTQHNQGDSLGSLAPGIDGATSRAAVKNADDNIRQILDALRASGQLATTDVFITADHGFSTISRQALDTGGSIRSYASSLSYPGVNQGFLPTGFVAIDLAHTLGLPLYDPDTTVNGPNNQPASYSPVDPTKGQRPRSGDGLIGGTGAIPASGQAPDAQVIVAANGGSDLIYVPSKDAATVRRIVDFLSKQDYTSGLFVDDAMGSIPGTLPLSEINLKGIATLPTPTIVINFRTFSTDSTNPLMTGVEVADTTLQQGQGMHGSFGRQDTFNTMLAIGPDFKSGYADPLPVSNADVNGTLATVLGFQIPSLGSLSGRTLSEALVQQAGAMSGVTLTPGVLASAPDASGTRTFLAYQDVTYSLNGATVTRRYFDAAGYAGRTVGLPVLQGGAQGGSLFAGPQDLAVVGGTAGDLLYAGPNPTQLISGPAADRFVLTRGAGLATVVGFDASQGDRIGLPRGFSLGGLSLRNGTGAYAGDTLIYSRGNRRLLAVVQGVDRRALRPREFVRVAGPNRVASAAKFGAAHLAHRPAGPLAMRGR